jgi:TolA-binding protein
LLILLIVGLFGLPGSARQTPQELAQQGDKFWDEDAYALALNAYQKALAADAALSNPSKTGQEALHQLLPSGVAETHLANLSEIELRVAIALIRAQRWDEAVAASEAFVRQYHDTPLEARGQVWRGRLYTQIVHEGYRVGERIYRGNNVPKSDGKHAPEYVSLRGQDARQAEAAFTRAKSLFEHFRSAKIAPAERPQLIRDEIELDFDLAHIHAQEESDLNRFDLKAVDWKIDLSQPFDPRWPAPKQVMYLYTQIPALNATLTDSDHHATVAAIFGEAALILRLRQWGQWYYYSPQGRSRRGMPYQLRSVVIPYQAIDPIRLLQDTLDRYPDVRDADRLAFTIAQWTEQQGDALKAASLYSAFIRSYPQSRWVSDAKRQRDTILHPSLTLEVSNLMTKPGERATVMLTTRNVSQVRFTAYRIHPEEVYGHAEYREGNDVYRPSFSNYARNFSTRNAILAYRREKVAEWTATTSNDGKRNIAYDRVTTPLDASGAYLIEARAGEHDELGAETVAIVSDLTLVQKVDKDSLLVYAADAETGKPIPNASLTIWAPRYYYTHNEEWDAKGP